MPRAWHLAACRRSQCGVSAPAVPTGPRQTRPKSRRRQRGPGWTNVSAPVAAWAKPAAAPLSGHPGCAQPLVAGQLLCPQVQPRSRPPQGGPPHWSARTGSCHRKGPLWRATVRAGTTTKMRGAGLSTCPIGPVTVVHRRQIGLGGPAEIRLLSLYPDPRRRDSDGAGHAERSKRRRFEVADG
jgi:hypothetical protein